MKISMGWLVNKEACREGKDWFKGQDETDGLKVVEKLMSLDKFNWANWLIVRLMKKKQKVTYAIFAAEQVLSIFEKRYPEDKRPRLAIEAAKEFLKDPTKKTRAAAWSAAWYSRLVRRRRRRRRLVRQEGNAAEDH